MNARTRKTFSYSPSIKQPKGKNEKHENDVKGTNEDILSLLVD